MDIYDLARKQFPKLVAQKLAQLRRLDTSAQYEQAFKEAAKQNPDLYEAYTHAIGR